MPKNNPDPATPQSEAVGPDEATTSPDDAGPIQDPRDEPESTEAAEAGDDGDDGFAGKSTAQSSERSATGKRVTHRTVHRRESEEQTVETITEDFPVYQGPASTHPAPVG